MHSDANGISLVAATDQVVLFQVDNQTYAVSDGDSPTLFQKPPGEVVLTNPFSIIFADIIQTFEADEIGSLSVFSLELWSTDGTEKGTQLLAAPIVDRDRSEGPSGTDDSALLGVQQFGNQIVVRFRTQRWMGEDMHIATCGQKRTLMS